MKTIAVTGAGGHIGNVVCRQLVASGYKVKALVFRDASALKGVAVEIIKGDIFESAAADKLLSQTDAVIHLAAMVSIGHEPKALVEHVNFNGTEAVIDAAIRQHVKAFYHVSSVHAHCSPGVEGKIDESTPYALEPRFAGYDRSKAKAEQAVIAARSKGLRTTIFNPTAVIGPFDFKPGLTGKLVLQLAQGKIPMLTPLGYDWVDVRDVADTIVHAIQQEVFDEKFLLTGEWAPLTEVARLTAQFSGRPAPKLVAPFWLAHAGVPFVQLFAKFSGSEPLYTKESLRAVQEGCKKIIGDKARKILNHNPRPLEETVKDTVQWFRDRKLIA